MTNSQKLKREKSILNKTKKYLSDTISIGFQNNATNTYLNIIDSALVAIQERSKLFNQIKL